MGVWIGRQTVSYKTTVDIIKLPPVIGSIDVPGPVFTGIPSEINWPLRTDTFYIDTGRVVIQSIDSAKVFRDWSKEKQYAFTVFDDEEKGKLDVDMWMQYNTLKKFNYEYVGVKTLETRYVERKFKMFIGVDYSTNYYTGIGGGFIYNHLALEYKYHIGLKYQNFDYLSSSNYHSLGIKYIF